MVAKVPLGRVLLLQSTLNSQLETVQDNNYDLLHDAGVRGTPEMLAKREQLHRHPAILSRLWAWWEAAAAEYDTDSSGRLEHNECVLTSVIALHYTYCFSVGVGASVLKHPLQHLLLQQEPDNGSWLTVSHDRTRHPNASRTPTHAGTSSSTSCCSTPWA